MLSSLARIRPAKKWTQIYMERADETKSRKHQMADADLDEEVSLNMVTSLLEAVSDISIVAKYNRINECKHNIDNVHPPPKQKDWDFIWGTQMMCNICVKPALNNSIMCKKCNIIVHTACAAKQKPITGRNLFESRSKIKRTATAPEPIHIPPEYNCPNCEESLIADLKFYEKLVTRLREEHMLEVSARMILRRFIIHFERRKLVKKRKAILLIQSLIRQRLARNQYKIWRKQLLRVVVFEMKHLPQKIMENGIVILTVFDTFKNMQLMRIDKTAECALQEAFFVAGVSAQMSVLITIGIREDAHTCYVVGQAHFCLRDIVDFSAKKMFTLAFVDKIKWPPQDPKHSLFTYKLEPPPTNSDCRSYFATPPANIIVEHSPESHNSGKTNTPIANNTSEMPHSRNNNTSSRNNNIYNDNTIRFLFNPQNCVASICRMVSAPPLDILKRSVENGQKNKLKKNNIGSTNQNIGNYRNSRYWLCVYKLKLILFQYYGDIYPRFITDLSDARAEVVREKGRTTSLVNIIHPDNRVWLFEFSNKNDANKFEFAVNESRKAKNEIKGSKFINSFDFAPSTETNFGFMTA